MAPLPMSPGMSLLWGDSPTPVGGRGLTGDPKEPGWEGGEDTPWAGWRWVGAWGGLPQALTAPLGAGGTSHGPRRSWGGTEGCGGCGEPGGARGEHWGGPWRSCWGHGGDLPRVIEFVVGWIEKTSNGS